MDEENSSKAVTLPPSTYAVTLSCTTPPLNAITAVTTAAGDGTHSSSVTTNTILHAAQPALETPLQPPLPQQSGAPAIAVKSAFCESDSSEEQPLFQHPQMLTPSLASQTVPPWSAVSATPPSALFSGLGNANPNGHNTNVLLPASVFHSEFANNSSSTQTGQHRAVCRDLSNYYSITSNSTKQQQQQQRVGGTAAMTVRSTIAETYMDNSNSESISNASLGALGRVGNLNGGHSSNNNITIGARRSLFRGAVPANSAMPASPLTVGLSRGGQRSHCDKSGNTEVPSTPITPALAGDAVLMIEPPTPAKQRRTIHTGSKTGNNDGSGHAIFNSRLPTTTTITTSAVASTNPYSSLSPSTAAAAVVKSGVGTAALAKTSTRSVAPMSLPPSSPSLARAATPSTTTTVTAAPSLSFKFHKREGSRKRSADVLSQFSALDLDETPATPYGQTVMNSRLNSFGGGANSTNTSNTAFPSQPFAFLAAQRGGGNSNNAGAATFVPTSPLLGGYTTPVTQSQQIGGSNTYSQMLLHPSQDALDMSQADTECSNFLARRIVNDYNEVRLLGRGSFGTVSLYKEISSGEYVAVKVSPPLRAPDMERRYRRERSIMGLARGMPHVVQLSAAWEEGRVPRMYLQLEYCPGGSLAALASTKQSRNEPWKEEEVKVFLVHMGIALDALHRANIAHVDFKPDNILIDKDGAYKLSDFGCSVLLDDSGRPRAETQNGYGASSTSPGKGPLPPHIVQHGRGIGSGVNNSASSSSGSGGVSAKKDTTKSVDDAAAAPSTMVSNFNWDEMNDASTASVDEGDCRYLCSDMLNEKKHFKAGDMFSLGMSLYELMSGQPLPRNGDQFLALRRQVPEEMLRRRGYSLALVKLVAALLNSDPTQRPTARQVLQYLRPSAAELQLLGDPSTMRHWTTSAEAYTALHEQQQQHERDQCGDDAGSPRATAAALRYLSALMEGTCWLLTTTQQDVHRALTKAAVESGDEEAEQHRQQQQQQPVRQCPPLPPQHNHRSEELEAMVDHLSRSPIMREEACTPTTLNY